MEDEFYDYYSYEPDEQSVEVQEKQIGLQKQTQIKQTWEQVFEKSSKKGVYAPDSKLWVQMTKIVYFQTLPH